MLTHYPQSAGGVQSDQWLEEAADTDSQEGLRADHDAEAQFHCYDRGGPWTGSPALSDMHGKRGELCSHKCLRICMCM
jgi:hypothetical protein